MQRLLLNEISRTRVDRYPSAYGKLGAEFFNQCHSTLPSCGRPSFMTYTPVEQPLDYHAVTPAAIQLPVPAMNPDFLETQPLQKGAARLVLGKHPADQFVKACRRARLNESGSTTPPASQPRSSRATYTENSAIPA